MFLDAFAYDFFSDGFGKNMGRSSGGSSQSGPGGQFFGKVEIAVKLVILEYVSGRVRTQISSRTVSGKIWIDPVRADPVGADPSGSRSSEGRSQRGPPPGPGQRSHVSPRAGSQAIYPDLGRILRWIEMKAPQGMRGDP